MSVFYLMHFLAFACVQIVYKCKQAFS